MAVPRIGLREQEALSATYFTDAGQLFVSTGSGRAAILGKPTVPSYLTHDGTSITWSPTADLPKRAVVASDVTHAQSSTTLSDVTGLLIPITASVTERWFFEAYLMVAAANANVDAKWGFTVPTSTTMQWGALANLNNVAGFAPGNSAATPTALASEAGTVAVGTGNLTFGVSLAGFILGGGTAGNAQLQFAQNTSDASNLTVKAGSVLRYTRLAA